MILYLALAVGLWSLWALYRAVTPLLSEAVLNEQEWSQLEAEFMPLLRRRDRLVKELKELEFEAGLQKIEPEEMKQLRHRYEAEAISLLEQIDEHIEPYQERIEAELKLL